ncbi:MAG: hypothetical protein WEE36_10040 [Acidimicrobiia bacterium]
MSAPDPQLRSLYARLEEVLGAQHADVLMAHLSPAGDVATKSDIAAIRSDLGTLAGRFDGLEQRFDGLEQRFDGLEQRFDGAEQRFDGLDRRFERFEERIDSRLERMQEIIVSQYRAFFVVAASFMTGLTAVFGVMLAVFK